MFSRIMTAAIACGMGLSAGAATADTIRATSAFGPNHAVAKTVYPVTFAKLEELTDGRWTGQDTPSGLVAPNEMATALRDGISDMGSLLIPYFIAQYPESSLPGELTMFGSRPEVVAAAVTEYTVTCEPCQEEFSENGQVYLASDTTPLYQLLSTRPVRTAEDMKGLKVRGGSPFYTAFIEQMGAVPVQMPSSELFEGLSQGVIEATFSSPHEMIANRLGDVIGYITEIDNGLFNGAALGTASALLWQRMSEDDRAAFATSMQYGITAGMETFNEQITEVKEAGEVEFIEPDQSLIDARDEFHAARQEAAISVLEERGVTDVAAKIERYKALVEKWEGLITEDMTPEQVAEIRAKEIWADVDLASYGQ